MPRPDIDSLRSTTFSPDSSHPYTQVTRHKGKVESDGTIALFQSGDIPLPEQIVKRANIGKVSSFERSGEPDNPFIFPQQGYQLERNQATGEYKYTVYPKLDFDFSFLDALTDAERGVFLQQLENIYPVLTVTNTADTKNSLKVRVGIGSNDVQLVSATPSETCRPNFNNLPYDSVEENNRIQAAAGWNRLFRYREGLEYKHLQLITQADIPIPTPPIRMLYDEYAKALEGELPPRRDILSIANTRVFLKERNPREDLLGK